MNESQAMPAPGTYFATNNGTDSLSLVSALKTNPLDEVTAYAAMDIKHEIWKAESDVQKAVQVQTNLINTNNLNLHNRLCESEKAAIEAKFEAKLETRDAVLKLNEKIDHEVEEVSEQLDSFEKSVDNKFCSLERRIDKQFCDLRERELQEEIRDLKNELSESNQSTLTANIVTQILAAIGVAPALTKKA